MQPLASHGGTWWYQTPGARHLSRLDGIRWTPDLSSALLNLLTTPAWFSRYFDKKGSFFYVKKHSCGEKTGPIFNSKMIMSTKRKFRTDIRVGKIGDKKQKNGDFAGFYQGITMDNSVDNCFFRG